ncbi:MULTISPECIES: hypothetical protein [unclassified Variovorax]|uniref:hypothetical protein n=1 Tax=unclassified Variovorax TaxID=663243 RepID=UPI00257598F2|nr:MULTISPECIES: hypothetical protein [unclassified Variovorax]MDM0090637.1 hypothetical protein [Variovorax sp. J22G40]MDM0149361.1 hypothetical protein [Variovorax sp. J2P1-31]
MTENERIAIAARLHVALRRKTGRVTDTEWMAANADYAIEVLRFARAHAVEQNDAELAAIADRLEVAMAPIVAAARLRETLLRQGAPGAPASRYVGGLR